MLKAHVEHYTVDAIRVATGLSRSTIQRWRRKPENMVEVEAARGDVVRSALARLGSGLGAAAERLLRVVEGSEREDVAVRAAVAMFDAHSKLSMRSEIDERLNRLEDLIRSGQNTPQTPWADPVQAQGSWLNAKPRA